MQISASLRPASRAGSRTVRVAQKNLSQPHQRPPKKQKTKAEKKPRNQTETGEGREEGVRDESDNGGLGYTLSIRQTFHQGREDCLLRDYCDMVTTNHGMCLKRPLPIVITKKRTAENRVFESIKSLYKCITTFYESIRSL